MTPILLCVRLRVRLQGHFGSELHGLCAHPSAPEFVTVGDDRMLRIWNIRDRKVRLIKNPPATLWCLGSEASVRVQVTRMLTLENPSRAVAYSPDADLIAVGFGSPLETSQVGLQYTEAHRGLECTG